MSDVASLIDETLAVMERMVEVLDRETAAIRQAEWSDLAVLQSEKARLARLCEKRQRELNRRADEVRATPDEVRRPLEAMSDRLGGSMQANLKALALAKEASSRVVTLIIETAKQAAHPGISYDRQGGRREAASNRSVSLRLNEQL